MPVKNLVETVTKRTVSTAVSILRHPIGSAAHAAGLVRGTAEAASQFVRGFSRRDAAAPADEVLIPSQRGPSLDEVRHVDAGSDSVTGTAVDAGIPKPQVVPKPVLSIDELPEPIVIEADDTPGEAFHTEPKAATRASEHGASAGADEELEDTYDAEGDQVVWTSESPVPDSVDEPLLDPAEAKAVRSESDVLIKAAERRVE